jgi:hypothetical protein
MNVIAGEQMLERVNQVYDAANETESHNWEEFKKSLLQKNRLLTFNF